MSTSRMDAAVVILGLKRHFGVESDEALATKLDVAKSTIATWRRRSSIPSKAAKELEARHGLRLVDLIGNNSEILREYLLRQVYYITILDLHRLLIDDGMSSLQSHEFADDLAIIEPYLKRAIIRAASADRYQGAVGAASFLLDVKAGKLDSHAWHREAKAERQRDLPAMEV